MSEESLRVAEERAARYRELSDRLRWEVEWLSDQWEISREDARRWRRLAEDQAYYLAVCNVNLAELADDDHFRSWRESHERKR